MKKLFILVLVMLCCFSCVCVLSEADEHEVIALEDGLYIVSFSTDSSMFRINETYGKSAVLVVSNGEMYVHVTLVSKNIVNLFFGSAEEAKQDSVELIVPSLDTVTYSDGYTEKVYGFDIPVPTIGEDFTVSIIGKKGKWYEHTVSVSEPVPIDQADQEFAQILVSYLNFEEQ